jgi:ABC-type multidrug transport system fused ATPase/permease subunit
MQGTKSEPGQTIAFQYRDIFFFLGFLRPLWALAVLCLCLTAVMSAITALMPLSGKVLIDYILQPNGGQILAQSLAKHGLAWLSETAATVFKSVYLTLLVFVGGSLLIGLLGLASRIMALKFQQAVTLNIQTSLIDHVLSFPLSFFKEKQVGELMSRVAYDVNRLQGFFSKSLPKLATDLIYLSAGFGILFSLERQVALLLLVAFGVLMGVNYAFARRARGIFYREGVRQADVSRHIQEVFSAVELVKSHTTERQETQKIAGSISRFFANRVKSSLVGATAGLVNQTSKTVLIALVVGFGVYEVRQGRMTTGDVAAFVAYVIYMSSRMQGVNGSLISMQGVFAAMARVKELFNLLPESGAGPQALNLLRPRRFHGEICFDQVHFAYKAQNPVLSGISFDCAPGEIVALSGKSGAGKSTLIALLLKFHLPLSGSIMLDGHDLRELDPKWLRRQIGIVAQDIFLFNASIAENIAYGLSGVDEQAVVQAAQKAGIHEEIMALPQGYQTLVGERGVKLSLGQRQRVSIARAFIRNPKILILDEPASALDGGSAQKVTAALDELRKGRSIIMVSHRMELAGMASKAFNLENGRLTQVR